MYISELEQKACIVLKKIHEHGFSAYFVGGYVRDRLLNRPIKDIDIATDALPDQVMRIFPKHVPSGLQHGTVMVFISGISFEVTTFRAESAYENHRRPQSVQFIASIEEDLKRRDFTINAMALTIDGELIDPFGGQADLLARRLRAVGVAEERFQEDALRLLRCIRFAAEYEFQIDEQTWTAVIQQKQTLKHIAMERVWNEFYQMINGQNPNRALQLLADSDLFTMTKRGSSVKLPLERIQWDLFNLSILKEDDARFASLFIACKWSSDKASRWLTALICPNDLKLRITRLLKLEEWMQKTEQHEQYTKSTLSSDWQRLCLQYGTNVLIGWISLQQNMTNEMSAQRSFLVENGTELIDGMPIHTKAELKIDGRMLMQFFERKPGRWIGEYIEDALEEVAINKLENTSDTILLWLKDREQRMKKQ